VLFLGHAFAQESLNVTLVGFAGTPDWALGVAVDSSNAYVAAFKSGLRIFSVVDPASPSEVGSFGSAGCQMRSVEVVGNLAYVADCDSSLRIISVTDPSTPVEVGRIELPARALGVAVRGGHAYVADDDSGLRVVAVIDPTHPVEVGHYSYVRGAYDVAVVGDYAYVADNGNGLCIVSVADPANPVEVGRYVGTGGAYGVAVAGGCGFLAAGSSGLRIISVVDQTHPYEVGYCDSLGMPTDVAVAGDLAYIAAWNGAGYSVVSFSDSEHPVEVGRYDIGNAGSVALRNGYAYVVGYAGMFIMEYYGTGIAEGLQRRAARVSLGSTIVHGSTVLWPETGPRTRECAELLDAAGRVLMSLKPGPNDVSRLEHGVYFVREGQQGSSRRPQAVGKIILVE